MQEQELPGELRRHVLEMYKAEAYSVVKGKSVVVLVFVYFKVRARCVLFRKRIGETT